MKISARPLRIDGSVFYVTSFSEAFEVFKLAPSQTHVKGCLDVIPR